MGSTLGPEPASGWRRSAQRLRNTDTQQALLNLAAAFESCRLHRKPAPTSGLIEQQRWFMKMALQGVAAHHRTIVAGQADSTVAASSEGGRLNAREVHPSSLILFPPKSRPPGGTYVPFSGRIALLARSALGI